MTLNNYTGIHIAQPPPPPLSFGPQRVIDIHSIHKQLGCFTLTSFQILTMTKDAMLHGTMLPDKLYVHNQVCHQIIHQNLLFILSQAFDAVITIYGTEQYFQGTHLPKNTSQQFAVQKNDDFAIIDEIVTDLFENDTLFLTENCDVLLPQSPENDSIKLQKQGSFYSNSSLSDLEDQCIETIKTSDSISESSSCDALQSKEYHTIYMKPIIERLKQLTGTETFSEDYIIKIVDESIKKGSKQKISKRTFEFKHNLYTIIMSKSLKTILDFTVSEIGNNDNVITVHPDVVSIITKKHKFLDYFRIKEIAKNAKMCGSFTTKKKDYRRQFIYEYSGCKIVFASNHRTIVEMHCNEPSIINCESIKSL